MCVQFFHMVNINVPAGVGAPPLNTAHEQALVCTFTCTSYMYSHNMHIDIYYMKGHLYMHVPSAEVVGTASQEATLNQTNSAGLVSH